MVTIHNQAAKKNIAKIALVCGDPKRAKNFAEQHLENFTVVNDVRNMTAITGFLKGTKIRVTVMGHGIGLESIGIYAYELYEHYDVDLIIRFGTAGTYNPKIKIGDIIVAEKAWTESNYGMGFGITINTLSPGMRMLKIAKELNEIKKMNLHFTTVHSSMWFYKTKNIMKPSYYVKQGIDIVEMEAYALYAVAYALKKEALTILTVFDNLTTNESMGYNSREKDLKKMFNLLISLVTKYNEQ